MTTKTIRRNDLLAELSSFDRGDGCLGIIIDEGLRRDPDVTAEELREVCVEAERDAEAERAGLRRVTVE